MAVKVIQSQAHTQFEKLQAEQKLPGKNQQILYQQMNQPKDFHTINQPFKQNIWNCLHFTMKTKHISIRLIKGKIDWDRRDGSAEENSLFGINKYMKDTRCETHIRSVSNVSYVCIEFSHVFFYSSKSYIHCLAHYVYMCAVKRKKTEKKTQQQFGN